MRKKVLISAPYMVRDRDKVFAMLRDLPLDVTWAPVRERLEEDQLVDLLKGYHGIICGDDRITAKVLDHAKDLQVIVKWGTGIDSIDKSEAERRGIPVCRTPNAFTEPVADTTLAYILAFCRRVVDNDRVLKNGGWDKPPGFSLSESIVGLIGFGDIGTAVARRLKGFGSTVLCTDVRPERAEIANSMGVKFVSLEEIFSTAHFISLHCDLNPTSVRILNRKSFAMMDQRPYIINTARGPLIEESALIDALEAQRVSGAGLDVFELEPLPVSSPLRKMQNVLLASHNSNNSPRCWDNVHRNSIQMLVSGLRI